MRLATSLDQEAMAGLLRRHLNDIKWHNWHIELVAVTALLAEGGDLVGFMARWNCYRDQRKLSFRVALIDGVWVGPTRKRAMNRKMNELGLHCPGKGS